MHRYKLVLEYEGTPFVGWQKQEGFPSVQQTLEDALANAYQIRTTFWSAGRTDAGVHALGQVAHIEIEKELDPFKLGEALNFHLRPHPIAILNVEKVPLDFHARFSATHRAYRYVIINRRSPLTVDLNRAWNVVGKPLDIQKMQEAAHVLLGQHDFTTFRSSECQAKSPVKTLDVLTLTQKSDRIEFFVKARSFLHHQVRNMIGTLSLVGQGKWSTEDVRKALLSKDRTKGGPTAPACGLYLVNVGYNED
jgi:tRNA pseudouridine38-40 synthase